MGLADSLYGMERAPVGQSHGAGNLGYVQLVRGGAGAEFLRLRDADLLGGDPVGAYAQSVKECARAFAEPGALERVLDYPLGKVAGRQALGVRTTDTVIHTWDLARAVGSDDRLDVGLVAWIDDSLEEIYAGLVETPTAIETTHRFFAAPEGVLADDAPRQDRLPHRMGREARSRRLTAVSAHATRPPP
jgi:uncharacterized protein (TIGR03086 family)